MSSNDGNSVMADTPKLETVANEMVPCPHCEGEGRVVVGEYRVTRDMALDAGEPSMEGMFFEYAYDQCEWCFGSGSVTAEEAPKEEGR